MCRDSDTSPTYVDVSTATEWIATPSTFTLSMGPGVEIGVRRNNGSRLGTMQLPATQKPPATVVRSLEPRPKAEIHCRKTTCWSV